MRNWYVVFLGLAISLLGTNLHAEFSDIPRPGPDSELILDAGLDSEFCAKWNPDFRFRGGRCCGRGAWRLRRRGIKCTPSRAKRRFCDEMTQEQHAYIARVETGDIPDVLDYLTQSKAISSSAQVVSFQSRRQAYCRSDNGFLAWGRPVLPGALNRISLRRPERCVNFGTDGMVAMLEWVGRNIYKKFSASEFQGTRLIVGDVSAPRGGCLMGKGGRKGHTSHMSGQDVDIGFLNVVKNKVSPNHFSRKFEAENNWWMIKQVFKNPFACVSSVFLDRRLIRRLKNAAKDDPDWELLSPHIRHVRLHRNHFHVRIGEWPGLPGCEPFGDSKVKLAEK